MERKISFLLDYLSLWLSIYNKMRPNVRKETSVMAVRYVPPAPTRYLRYVTPAPTRYLRYVTPAPTRYLRYVTPAPTRYLR